MNGSIVSASSIRNYDFEICSSVMNKKLVDVKDLPSEYILDEKLLPPIHNQEETSKCVAYALCEAAESESLKNSEFEHYSTDWEYGRQEIRGNYDGPGLFADNAVNGTLKLGFLPLRYFSYHHTDVPDIIDIANSRDDLLQLSIKKPKSYASFNYALESKKWDSIRQALYTYQQPLVIVSHDFFRGGSHAILMIGWSEKNGNKYVEFQNSWDKDYKESGRYRFTIDYLDQAYILFWEDLKFPFKDVRESDWYYKEVKHSYLAGLIKGVTDDTFEPDGNMIRGDLAIILDRYLHKCQVSYNSFATTLNNRGFNLELLELSTIARNPFTDIETSDYWYDSVVFVFNNFLMNGDTFQTFAPTDTVTRAMLATVAVRAFSLILSKVKSLVTIPVRGNFAFKDVLPDKWYYDYIVDAYNYGIVSGDNPEEFRPDDDVTRAEATAILYRLFKKTDELFDEIMKQKECY